MWINRDDQTSEHTEGLSDAGDYNRCDYCDERAPEGQQFCSEACEINAECDVADGLNNGQE